MRTWWRNLKRSFQRRRNETALVRDQLVQARSEDHLAREEAWIRDVPPAAGPL